MFFDIYALELCFPLFSFSGHCFGGQLYIIHLTKYWGSEIIYSVQWFYLFQGTRLYTSYATHFIFTKTALKYMQ